MTEGVQPGESRADVTRSATLWAMGLLTAMNLLNYIDRYVMPAVIRSVSRDIPMTDAQRGFALSAFIWVFMATAPIFGRLGDRGSRKILIAIGVAVWSLATGAAAFVHTLAGLMLARAAVGIGEAAYATVAPSLIGDYYPAKRRGVVLSMFYLAIPVGSAMGYGIGGALSANYGWRTAFLAVGLPGLILAAAALSIREPKRGRFDEGHTTEAIPFRRAIAHLASNRLYVWTVAGGIAYTFAIGGLAQWMPTYLQRERHLGEAHAAIWFGAITALAGFVGTAAGGALAERMKGRVRDPYLWVSGVSVVVSIPFALGTFMATTEAILWPVVFAALTLLFMSTGPFNTVLINSVSSNYRSMAFAVSIFATHAFGDALSPYLIGVVSDATNLQTAVLLVPVALFVTAGCWIFAERRVAVKLAAA